MTIGVLTLGGAAIVSDGGNDLTLTVNSGITGNASILQTDGTSTANLAFAGDGAVTIGSAFDDNAGTYTGSITLGASGTQEILGGDFEREDSMPVEKERAMVRKAT